MPLKPLLSALALAGLCGAALSPAGAADADADWWVAVQQGGRQHAAGQPARLQRAPFNLVFSGPPTWAFSALASADCAPLEALKTPEQVGQVVRPANAAAEGAAAAENTFLVVNPAGAVARDQATAHLWADDKGSEVHSFQRLVQGPMGVRTATRQVQTLLLADETAPGRGQAALPVARYTGAELCVLVTGLPPVGHLAHRQPTLLRLVFQ